MNFTGKQVLVVGGSSGIGNAAAQAFRAAGAEVAVWGTRPAAEDYRGDPGCDLEGLVYHGVDVADRTLVDAAPGEASLDALVLCQGIVVYERGEFGREGWDRVMAVNLDSLMDCANKFRPALARAGGSLVIVSSVSGLRANRGNPAYAASKAAAISLTRTLAQAWAGEGIRVNGVAPGLVETKLTRATMGLPHRLEAALAGIPLRRAGTPAEIAQAILFLASPISSYVVGHTLVVDGGLTL